MKKNIQHTTILFMVIFISSCSYDEDQGSATSWYGYEGVALGGDKYAEYEENPFVSVEDNPVSTFSIDADGASYANVRRFIFQDRAIPPMGAIRTEELINYFDFNYLYTSSEHPIALNGEVSICPWNISNKLIRIGLKGKPIPEDELPPSNYVFLIDVSGSMSSEDKLELLKQGFIQMVDELSNDDRVAIVTYAGYPSVALSSTLGNEKAKIKQAISALGSGGSTAGAAGINTAYEIAEQHFVEGGNNRIILGSDGDFNVGPSSQDELVEMIEEKRESGIFLTVLGVGRGNLNDASMEQIANHGNGTYEYIDNIEQLKKVFIYDYSKFYTVAKDVKVQVTFNPAIVESYRLIGYENRLLDEEDFEDDEEDAGEIGANQNITALYEIVPVSSTIFKSVPTFTIDFRYKRPDSDTSIPMELEVFDQGIGFSQASQQMQFAGSVAAFSMLLMDSPYKGTTTYTDVADWLDRVSLPDEHAFKHQFGELVQSAAGL